MAFTNSARDQFVAVVPDNPATPTVPAHLQAIVDAIETQVVLKAADWSFADTFIAPYVDGMLLSIASPAGLYYRVDGAWEKIWPVNLTGTGDPAPGLGDDGDLYFKTAP